MKIKTSIVLKVAQRASCVIGYGLCFNLVFGQSENQQLTTAAWDAYRSNLFNVAISNAQACIDSFEIQARDLQVELVRTNAPMPPTGRVSTNVFDAIHANGLLNDVATCYFIIGESKKQLVAKKQATIREVKEAYERAQFFTYARCWDTNDLFWSVPSTANARLRKLPPTPN
jgi:hypothetical protein